MSVLSRKEGVGTSKVEPIAHFVHACNVYIITTVDLPGTSDQNFLEYNTG
jgi:hypothetical protein